MLTQRISREATSVTPGFDILKSLDVFLTVADAGSMTTASRRLGVTQSAISQQIKLLEAEFGAPLFDRQDRPLTLTAAGAALYERAGRLVLDVKETWTFVRQSAAMSLPHLRLAVLSTFARDLVPALMAATDTGELPIQHLSVMRGVSQGHMQDLINRKTDVAITSDALYQHDSIERHALLREKYVVIVPAGAVARDADLHDIVSCLPFIRYTSRITSGQLIERHFRRLQLDLSPKFAFESPEDLISSVAAGYGWSVVAPSQLAHVPEYAAKIDTYLLPALGLARTITLITRKGEFSNVTSVLVKVCRQVLRDGLIRRAAVLLPDMADVCVLVEDEPDEPCPG
jgi:DNA-binding transcriptional LysR family regulator